ncbi:hypothetical protein GGR51DRAFT_560201 [Nemania sp. FL0031]|nr:hypothetical protein GGR51DRAFT_560201 [Nemania sp. FL0031]
MRYANIFLGLLWVAKIYAGRIPSTAAVARGINGDASVDGTLSVKSFSRRVSKLPTSLSRSPGSQNNRRDTVSASAAFILYANPYLPFPDCNLGINTTEKSRRYFTALPRSQVYPSPSHIRLLPLSCANPSPNNAQYPINCHIHNWPSADVDSIKQAYSWFYQLWAPFEADAQHCNRIACFGDSAVWMCADTLGFQSINSVRIADEMNDLLDGDHGCLDAGNKNKVEGMKFTSEGWSVVVRGGEDCSANVPETPIFY